MTSQPVDLQALFANLKPRPRDAPHPQAHPDEFQSPVLGPEQHRDHSLALFPSHRTAPASSSRPYGPPTSAAPETVTANHLTSQSLLSLLNFGQSSEDNRTEAFQAAQGHKPTAESIDRSQTSAMSASDLVAQFMPSGSKNMMGNGSARSEDNRGVGDGEQRGVEQSTTSASQDALLRLLNRSTSNGTARFANSHENVRANTPTVSENIVVPEDHGNPLSPQNSGEANHSASISQRYDSSPTRDSSPLVAPKPEDSLDQAQERPLFTYKNPFEALNASRNQSPKPKTPILPTSHPPTKASDNGMTQPTSDKKEVQSSTDTSSFQPTRKILTPRISGRIATGNVRENSGSMPQHMEDAEVASDHGPQPKDVVIRSEEVVSSNVDEGNAASEHENDESPEPEPQIKQSSPVAETTEEGGKEQEMAEAWESADESPIKETGDREIPVFNFPIKPFVSITLLEGPPSIVGIREDGVMEISRLKKEFDQIDRSLACATSKYISYALVKNGGMRIIRQDDGSDRQVFKNSHDRVFNVSFCSTAMVAPPSNNQAVLGTGVSGSVYYATVSKDGSDLFEENLMESESLVFPPFPAGDENTSGGVLKTRAKRSSRHPEFFGVGRGKSIYLIWPATVLSPRFGITSANRKVDIEKLYKERALRITTGKAGKDFTFSEDDSLIASLDKTGRVRFWDIRPLVNEANATAAKVTPTNVDTALMTLSTASPAEKSWPTSVLFVDKVRPYTKSGALRYLLVGLRQNHTLQLWDIALGKAVQELNFPHEAETDGICSINYHPNSGIIVVGHPTRNSIYFIHLSAPRYSLPPMSQSSYVEGIMAKDPDIPKPDSTACMSGIREMSFAEKGHLRSVELLPIYKTADENKASSQNQGLFELYVVHSKGVTCLNIGKEDLGWDSNSKVLKPINAVAEGLISIKDFRIGGIVEETTSTKSQQEEVSTTAAASNKKSANKILRNGERAGRVEQNEVDMNKDSTTFTDGSAAHIPSNSTPTIQKEKKSKKKGSLTTESVVKDPPTPISPAALPAIRSPIKDTLPLLPRPKSPSLAPGSESKVDPITTSSDAKADVVATDMSEIQLDKEFKKIEKSIAAEFHKEFNVFYQNIQNDRNVQDSASVARQEAVLRLVSSTLSTNVEKSLSRIISTQMHQVVVPAITGVAVQAVTAQVGEAVARALHQLVPHELSTQMPVALNAALQNPQIAQTISESVTQQVSLVLERQVAEALQKTVIPALRNLAIIASEKAAGDVESRLTVHVRQLESDRNGDVAKIEKLGQLLQGLAETMQTMSNSQVAFQEQILRDRKQSTQPAAATMIVPSQQVSTARTASQVHQPRTTTKTSTKTYRDTEFEEVSTLMNQGKYEEGSIRWLQSTQPVELFDNLFVRYTPEYLATDVSPLVAFSVAVTVANSLATHTARRIEWIDAAFGAVDLKDPEIADLSEHAPALLSSLIQKLDGLRHEVAQDHPEDAEYLLQIIPSLTARAREMKATMDGGKSYRYHYGHLES